MPELYFNVIKDLPDKVEHKFSPLYFNFTDPPRNAKDCLLINKGWIIFSYVKSFPGRTIKNLKISLDDNLFAVYSSDLSYLDQEWYGITIAIAEKELLPLKRETNLSSQVYKLVSKYFDNKDYDGTRKKLSNLFSSYCNEPVNEMLNNLHDKTKGIYLEELVVPSKDSIAKWDFFLMKESGDFLNEKIFRHHYNRLFKLDMDKAYSLPQYEPLTPLNEIHEKNCMALSACYLTCNLVYKELGFPQASLRHITTKLHDDLGTGFTFIDEAFIDDDKVLFVLDVKNKLHKKGKYVNKLFGNERIALTNIKNQLLSDDINVRLLAEGSASENERVFQTVKKAIKEVVKKK